MFVHCSGIFVDSTVNQVKRTCDEIHFWRGLKYANKKNHREDFDNDVYIRAVQ